MSRPRLSDHGTGGYRRGCRCDVCKAANSRRRWAQKARHGIIPVIVTSDVDALRRALCGRTPDMWPNLERVMQRALEGRRVTLWNLDAIAVALGVHVDSLIRDAIKETA